MQRTAVKFKFKFKLALHSAEPYPSPDVTCLDLKHASTSSVSVSLAFAVARLQDPRVSELSVCLCPKNMGRCGGSGVGMKLASGGRFRIEPWLAEGLTCIPASPRTQPDQEPGVQATRGPQPRTSDWSPIWSTTLTNPPINKFKTKDGGARYVPQIILTIITSLER